MSREVLIHGLRLKTDLRTLCSTVINDLMSNVFERVHVRLHGPAPGVAPRLFYCRPRKPENNPFYTPKLLKRRVPYLTILPEVRETLARNSDPPLGFRQFP